MMVIPAGTPGPMHLRLLVFGEHGAGKTSFAGTFPAPLLVHCATEGGYKTFSTPGGNLFPVALVGDTHSAWIQGLPGSVRVSEEITSFAQMVQKSIHSGEFPYQTIVLGGFSVMQRLVLGEAEKLFPPSKNKKGSEEVNGWSVYGYVANWVTHLIQVFFNLPVHVIIECNLKERKEGRTVVGLEPDIFGAGKRHIQNAVDVVALVQQFNGAVYGSFAGKKRFATSLGGVTSPIANPSYDFIAEKIGLAPIQVADPNHPRCRGVWPYTAHLVQR